MSTTVGDVREPLQCNGRVGTEEFGRQDEAMPGIRRSSEQGRQVAGGAAALGAGDGGR
jgi:hypothetical protein